MKRIIIFQIICFTVLLSSCAPKQETLSVEQAEEIAEEAYIYAFPLLEQYKMLFVMVLYPESGAYEGPFNTLINKTQLLGPDYTFIVRPNNDTFYSGAWLNLTGEPMVLKVPDISDKRYYAFQVIDMYTHNIDYIGTRATGFEAGEYLFVGPNWEGEKPEGIIKVIKSEGNYLLLLGRTQVFGVNDVENAKTVMQGYELQPLNKYLGKESTVQTNALNIPVYNPEKVKSVEFISYLNAIMSEGQIHKSEKELFEKFAKIGIKPGKDFDIAAVNPKIKSAIEKGIASAINEIKLESTKLGERKNGWQLVSDVYGTREAMQNKYLTRAAGAYFGLYGNSLEEAFYPETSLDSESEALNGSEHNYILHFNANELPPVKAFWSLSMYKLPEQHFIHNEINRYVISSTTEGLEYNEDGSLDIYIQKDKPDIDKISNWLPAHNGLFSIQARLYWPETEALNPLYTLPSITSKKQ